MEFKFFEYKFKKMLNRFWFFFIFCLQVLNFDSFFAKRMKKAEFWRIWITLVTIYPYLLGTYISSSKNDFLLFRFRCIRIAFITFNTNRYIFSPFCCECGFDSSLLENYVSYYLTIFNSGLYLVGFSLPCDKNRRVFNIVNYCNDAHKKCRKAHSWMGQALSERQTQISKLQFNPYVIMHRHTYNKVQKSK